MPKRTNRKQEIIALLRRALASDCEIEESVMLEDAVTGDEAEVDIVMRCPVEELVAVVSFEVVGWSRKAGRPWVHQQICKHANLPTEKLVLVSWSGFSSLAEKVAQTTPHITLLTVQTETVDGSPAVRSLGAAEARLLPQTVVFAVTKPDDSEEAVRARPDNIIFDEGGTEIGSTMVLAQKIVRLPQLGKRVLQDALKHPERDSLRSFVLQLPLEGANIFLRKEPTLDLHRITAVRITGALEFKHETFDLNVARLGDVLFGYGDTSFGGHGALVAALINDDNAIGAGSMRLYEHGNSPP